MDVDRFFSVFKTAGRGLSVQRQNIEIAAENIANAGTTRRAGGVGPYRPKMLHTSVGSRARFDRALKDSILDMQTTDANHRSAPSVEQDSLSNRGLGPEAEIRELEKYRFEYDPHHPDADENGMVKYPDIDMVEEMTRMVSANRLYEANLSVIEAEKEIIKRSLEI